MREMIEGFRRFARTRQGDATLTGAAVFCGLYLAVVIGLSFTFSAWGSLIWPYSLSWLVLEFVLFSLGAFAGVALYVYWLRLRILSIGEGRADDAAWAGERERALTAELERCREETRVAIQRRKDAESRATAAEANARAAEQAAQAAGRKAGASQSRATGGDDKFQAAKRAFARLYHPDNVKGEGLDRMIRAEIFKEYWRELEAIDKSAKR